MSVQDHSTPKQVQVLQSSPAGRVSPAVHTQSFLVHPHSPSSVQKHKLHPSSAGSTSPGSHSPPPPPSPALPAEPSSPSLFDDVEDPHATTMKSELKKTSQDPPSHRIMKCS
jgi:hypothetical protein